MRKIIANYAQHFEDYVRILSNFIQFFWHLYRGSSATCSKLVASWFLYYSSFRSMCYEKMLTFKIWPRFGEVDGIHILLIIYLKKLQSIYLMFYKR